MRLGHREGARTSPVRQPRQEPLLLLLGAVVPDHPAGDEVPLTIPDSVVQPRESSITISA